jgi:Protein of unknown function (DUF3667)
MSKKHYRSDKTCLNCRHVVADKFCSNCGQENVDTRKTFHHLFVHFFEDLTHYENAFWRTIKNLLFKPSALTKEYLSGKRLSYLAPVRLYIFISFLTFFLMSMFPDEITSENLKAKPKEEVVFKNDSGFKITKKNNYYNQDSIKKVIKDSIPLSKEISKATKDTLLGIIDKAKKRKLDTSSIDIGFDSIEALDSAKASGEINKTTYWLLKKALKVKENNTKDEIVDKGISSAKSNFPKVLLLYMPIFAFFLWLFHGKKRWYYFDHGIFTLHYFSFLLLIFLLVYIVSSAIDLFVDNSLTSFLEGGIELLGFGWMFYYFFPAHHRFYGEKRRISFLKSIVLFWINMFFIIIFLTCFFLYTIINIH